MPEVDQEFGLGARSQWIGRSDAMTDQASMFAALLTTMGTIFVVELTDKDALFLLALATRARALVVFAAGSVAFAISTGIIITVGSVLIAIVPVFAIKLAGGVIMLGYAGFEYFRFSKGEEGIDKREERILGRKGPGPWSVFLPAVVTLIALDLAGDATELVTIVLLARFQDVLVVFIAAVIGLVGAVAVETTLGNRLGRVLSPNRIKYLSIVIFVVIGATVIATTLLGI
ncbi:MAG TPA: TMEM165/GDT1 family protein [Nitrososphaerales archaeon]|nr:TMEM165/GDT1 family protein [Nitrososphaerales archaeon]